MIIDRSLELAYSLFPTAYSGKTKYRTYHFSFAWRSSKIISIGQNDPDKTNAKAMWFARRFKNKKQVDYPYLHAEVDMLSKLWGKYYINSRMKVVVIRINSRGELQNSKPCSSCSHIFSALGVDKIWFSTKSGNVTKL